MSEAKPVRVIGSYLSPYVRKVLAVLHRKDVPYEIDPIIPFFGNDRFSELSPLRRIPVLLDDRVTLCDSTVICEYLDERHPTPPIFPSDVADRARARWLEEYADSRMGDVFIWRLFNQVAIKPFVFGEEADPQILAETLDVEIPAVMDFLEDEVPTDGFLFGADPLVADIAIAAFFRNAAFARFRPDPARHPRTAAFVERVLSTPALSRLVPFEDALIRTPPSEHRRVLAELGAPLTRESLVAAEPRRGPMSV